MMITQMIMMKTLACWPERRNLEVENESVEMFRYWYLLWCRGDSTNRRH
jgi:hypothetical protein